MPSLSKYLAVMLVLAQLLAAAYAAPRIALVQGTSSMPTAAEGRYAASLTRRLSRWLDEIPIEHAVLTDDTLTDTHLQGIDVLILGYNPHPGTRAMAVLGRYAQRGGKLIIFYSAEPALAELMGMRLGAYEAAKGRQCWSAMRFTRGWDGAPSVVRQFSRSIRPVYPASSRAAVAAEWDNEKGRPSGRPAVVTSPRGIWVTHVLLDDGDLENKKRLLLASVGRHLPAVWRGAAEHALEACGRVGDAETARQVWRDAFRDMSEATAPAPAREYYRRAAAQYTAARRAMSAGHYRETVDLCNAAEELLIRAIAANQRPRPGEIRGVWDHTGLGLYPGDWNRTCQDLRMAGITDVYVNLLWPGKAHYPSRIVPRSREYTDYGDQAAASVRAGRRNGVRVHAWKVCWNLEGAPESFIETLKTSGRLQVNASGETLRWLCPSRADNVQAEVAAVREVVERYEVDGVHLDYIRYPDSSACCCTGCRDRFAHDTGLVLTPWPASLKKPSVRAAYDTWRCRRITHLVREVREMLQQTCPAVRLSVAVFGRYPLCKASVAQDWHLWLERDYVDAVCPMNYTDNPADFRRWLALQVALPGVSNRILPGIGVTAKDCNLDPVQVMGQIREVRRLNLPGYLLFDLNQTLARETLPALALGISAK